MNNSDLIEVFKVLYDYKNEEANTNIPDYPLTDCDFVKTLSKSVTDIIYDSYLNNSTNASNTRDVVIDLLSKLIEPNCHIPVDESNYDVFIKCLNKEPLVLDTFYEKYGQEFVNVCTKTSHVARKDDWKNICGTINRKYCRSLQNKIKSGAIQTWHKLQFDKNSFNFNVPNITYQNLDVETSIEFLNNLKDDSNTVDNEETSHIEINISEDNTNIQLAYALLNFECNSDIEKLFLKVLDEVSSSQSGRIFVEHIWKNIENLNLLPSIYIASLKKFKYLFEKPIINLATEILENLNRESVDYEYEILLNDPVIVNILKLCNSDTEICSYVIFVLNKLLFFSRFDVRMLKLLNAIKKRLL